ncbi:MAG: LuxR C-terminal-related transcriptional regulator [Planctomycetota bacterium]
MTATDRQISVVLVDDEALVRAGVRTLLERSKCCRVVGESTCADDAVARIGQLRPDLVLFDVQSGPDDLDAIARMKSHSPNSRVVVTSRHDSRVLAAQALRAGADGYLPSTVDPAELCKTIEAIHRGAGGAALVAGVEGAGPAVEPASVTGLAALTARELEVFRWIASGKANKEIALQLGISLGTVKKHRENLQRKLDIHSAAELARLAIREGLLRP